MMMPKWLFIKAAGINKYTQSKGKQKGEKKQCKKKKGKLQSYQKQNWKFFMNEFAKKVNSNQIKQQIVYFIEWKCFQTAVLTCGK